MTSDEQGFLAAIRADRDNDVIRGAYADWLDEHDRPERAEFIRVQILLAAPDHSHPAIDPTGDGCTVCGERRARELKLWAKNCIRWAGMSDEHYHLTGSFYGHSEHWRRGFIATASCPAAVWVAIGDDILAQHPVEVVRLTDFPGDEFMGLDLIDAPPIRAFTHHRWPGVRFELLETIRMSRMDNPERFDLEGVDVVDMPPGVEARNVLRSIRRQTRRRNRPG